MTESELLHTLWAAIFLPMNFNQASAFHDVVTWNKQAERVAQHMKNSLLLGLLPAIVTLVVLATFAFWPEVAREISFSQFGGIWQAQKVSMGSKTLRRSCPRPSDQYGPRYETKTGTFLSRSQTPGGGKFVVIKELVAATPQSESVTNTVFHALGSVPTGTVITLFSYVTSSASGANPPYSCVEFFQGARPYPKE